MPDFVFPLPNGVPKPKLATNPNSQDSFVKKEYSNWGLIYQKYLMLDASNDYKVSKLDMQRLSLYILPDFHYPRLLNHRKEILEKQCHCIQKKMSTDSRMLIGVGNASVTEVGFTFHTLYGFPIIPSSTLKGITLSHFKRGYPDIHEKFPFLQEILFGHQPQAKEEIEGNLIFYDAWPENSNSKLFYMDVMTPHYQRYYSDAITPPSSCDSPIPIPFLTLQSGIFFYFWVGVANSLIYRQKAWGMQNENRLTEFPADVQKFLKRYPWDNVREGLEKTLVALSIKQPVTAESMSDVLSKIGCALLCKALQKEGVGAKTGSGYGYFSSQERE